MLVSSKVIHLNMKQKEMATTATLFLSSTQNASVPLSLLLVATLPSKL